MTEAELKTELRKRVRLASADIRARTIRRPFRIIFPWVLEKIKASTAALAHTFWGGKMEVVLPELVSTHLYRFGYFDHDVSFYMIDSLQDGGVFIDVGSHFGSFSLLASDRVGPGGRVISIDPTPSTFSLMEKNLKRYAPHRNFETINVALYDREGITAFYDFGLTRSAYNSLLGSRNESIPNADRFKIDVQTVTLDHLVEKLGLTRIDFIKIDAESAELAIMKGAVHVLEKFSPRITVEIGDTGLANAPTSREIISFLESHRYSPFELHDGELVPHLIRDDYSKDKLACYNLLFVRN